MKKVSSFLLALLLIIISVKPIIAFTDPTQYPNNIFGIHLMDENDLDDAAKLVNSSGGDWGYVTFVIREDERDSERWTRAFNKMEELHLIPLIRVATIQTQNGWRQGKISEITNWKNFFDSLPWFTENRYIIIGNEPNHITEWGGEINPEEYSDYLIAFSKALKNSSRDYFILPAGLDSSAPDDSHHMSADVFLEKMYKHNSDFLESIDGWNSHSYPNPAFMGSVSDTGKTSIRSFEWELETLESLGLDKTLPVFITETGWAHDYLGNGKYLTDDIISENYKEAFQKVWSDPRVVAVTPFILNFPGEPFSKFSWKDKNGTYYSFYTQIQNIPKVKGNPEVLEKYNQIFFVNSVYNLHHTQWTT